VEISSTKTAPVILYITGKGRVLADRISSFLPGAEILEFSPALIPGLWSKRRSLIFIMASGIVVRTIATFLKDKKADPAVIVIDEKARHVISLVGGHLGGANELSREIASRLGAEPVITTASDVNSLPSIDLWAQSNGLVIENWDSLPRVATRLLNEEKLSVFSEIDISLPREFALEQDPRNADILVTKKQSVEICGSCVKDQLLLRPKNLVVGIGCNSATQADEIESTVRLILLEHNLSFLSIHSLATIDIKAAEPGLVKFAAKYGFPLLSFPAAGLNTVGGVAKSETVFKATGAYAVSEPAALLASGASRLLLPKRKSGNVTVSVALKEAATNEPEKVPQEGKLYVVGIGPGNLEHITPRARRVIEKSDVVVGYDTYLELIPELIAGKEVFSTGMTREIARCRKAVELALAGKRVAVISGGDPGIYAMAGPVFEMLKDTAAHSEFPPAVEIVPGISALNAAAALLGAPLMHDFASISLSDRLTPWNLIEERLNAAASSDFVIVLYNPKSRGRVEHFSHAVRIIAKYRKPGTPVGVVKSAMRTGQKVTITDMRSVLDQNVDMQTTVIFGNSKTYVWNGCMLTPRGYESKR